MGWHRAGWVFLVVMAMVAAGSAMALAADWTADRAPLTVEADYSNQDGVIKVKCRAKNPVMEFALGSWECKKMGASYKCDRKEMPGAVTERFCDQTSLLLTITDAQAADPAQICPQLCLCKE